MAKIPVSKEVALFPRHIAIVPDGNGRWAERRGLPRLSGHRAGAENTRRIIKYLNEYPIENLTIYGFSTENWNRPDTEVKGLFGLLEEYIDKCVQEISERGVKLHYAGRLHELPQTLQQSIVKAIELTKNNTGMNLCLAFNYGGRAEVGDGVRRLLV